MIKAVLFDYGETLIRSVRPWDKVKPIALRAAYRFLKREGLDLSYDRYVEMNESVFHEFAICENRDNRDFLDVVKYRQLVGELFPFASKTRRRRLSSEVNNAFWKAVLRNYTLQRNTRRSLNLLKAMKVKMAVVSNHHNPDALVWHLEKTGILNYFYPVIASAQLKFRKPDPRIFKTCLSTMKIRPKDAVFVGDSFENDVVGAKNAGLVSVLIVNHGQAGEPSRNEIEPDLIIRDLMEVPQVVSDGGPDDDVVGRI